jgi:hypothetical protein
MGFLPLVFRHFPDAVIVHTHRDPLITVSSFAALALAARRANQFCADAATAGRYCLEYCAARTRTYMQDRAALHREGQFVDVAYRDVVADVQGAVRRVYAAAGLELTPGAVAAMLEWERSHAQHKHGAHSYSVQDFGLTSSEIAAEFHEYIARFGSFF